MGAIGPTFGDEVIAAGLGGLPFSWDKDTSLIDMSRLTADQIGTLNSVIAAHNPNATVVPKTVSPRQARLALNANGLLDKVTTAVASSDKATQLTWEFATEIDRNSQLIATLGSQLGLTPAQIDALFIQAAHL
jgi:hypothetical protein